MNSRFRLGIIELYWDKKHTIYDCLEGRFIMVTPVNLVNFYSKGFHSILYAHYLNYKINYFKFIKKHNLIRNYYKIYSNLNNYKISIIEIIKINGINTSIDKTFFLKILQRKIRKRINLKYSKDHNTIYK